MTNPDTFKDLPPILISNTSGFELSGCWTLRYLLLNPKLFTEIKTSAHKTNAQWNLLAIESIDSATALILWESWGELLPENLLIKPEHLALLERWQTQKLPPPLPKLPFFSTFGKNCIHLVYGFWQQFLCVLTLQGQLFHDGVYLLSHPTAIPWSEISISIYDTGVRALGITALVGFLIGIVLSYLSALQLKMFGAEIYIISILGLSIIRELGPLLAAILVAGRSGSSMTAQIGIMRVTEELDALSAMGISHSLRLVFPKVVALIMVLPLLSIWTSTMALFGGMFAAQSTLDIGVSQFLMKLPNVVPLQNVIIGFGKSAVFGLAIALIACHFGFKIQPNTESLGNETTNSVVAAITVVIVIDAACAILFMGVGI
jgi:phospholipid/cholesterol/gamma-HCH transport system permease protein